MPPINKQTTEAEIAAYTVGELKPHDAPIKLASYDPAWPKPVWGALPRQPYLPARAKETVKKLAFNLGLPYP